jgi:hypothetical protein
MIKFTKFSIGKNKKYKGWCLSILLFKIEKIWFKNKFLYRVEISNWRE